MNLYNSHTYLDDLDIIIKNFPIINELQGNSILITGATGLICSAVADLLLRYNETVNEVIHVYVAGRDENRAKNRFNRYCNKPYFHFVKYDATSHNGFPFHFDYIVHGASNAAPVDFQAHQIDTMLDNFNGLYELLSYAEKHAVKSTLFISSSEVYGKKDTLKPFSEDEYGYVDILGPRSAYPSSKRAAETLCACFSNEKNVHTVIARPGHIYGPTAKRSDNRVSSAFAYDAADGKDLVMKSDGSQIRSYCYMLDTASAIIMVLLKGNQAEAYNISNPNSVITIREMAEMLAESAGVNTSFSPPSEEEKRAFNPMKNSSLKSEKLQKLGWKGLFDAKTGLEHTVRIIREAENECAGMNMVVC